MFKLSVHFKLSTRSAPESNMAYTMKALAKKPAVASKKVMKKAMKKPNQEKWKALMWGREKLQSLISVALSS